VESNSPGHGSIIVGCAFMLHSIGYEFMRTRQRSIGSYTSHGSIRNTIATSRRWTMAKLGRYSEVSAHRPSTNVLFEYYPTSLTILRCFPDSTKSSKDHVDEPCCAPTIRCAKEQQCFRNQTFALERPPDCACWSTHLTPSGIETGC
jgi:hypothetical protein